jgi:hypothetical protein
MPVFVRAPLQKRRYCNCFHFFMQPHSIRQKLHINQGAAKQGGEKANKDSTVHYSHGPMLEATPVACGSQASINIAMDLNDSDHR